MAAILTRQRSLRHIERSLGTRREYLKQFGVGSLKRATLSHASTHRPYQEAEAFFEHLLARCTKVAPGHPLRFHKKLFHLDATVIRVCHTLHRWALWAPERAGIKLHVALDHGGQLPTVIDITSARVCERTVARQWTFPKGTVLCFDRGYFDSGWFRELCRQKVIFVTRWSYGARYRVVHERAVEPGTNVLADQDIRFTGCDSRRKFRGVLRLITYRDPNRETPFFFVTNQQQWSAQQIADIYKARWYVEVFFKWLKQQLPVLHFYGRSAQAIRWQLYAALCVYLLLAWLKYQHQLPDTLTAIRQRIEPHLFDKVDILDLLKGTYQFDP